METNKFEALIKRVECDTLNDIQLIGFSAKNNNYALGFFAEEKNNYKIEVEDFGREFRGKWQQDEPNEDQLKVMQNIINEKIIEIQNLPSENEIDLDEEILDHYEYNGVKRSDFY